MTNQIMTHKGVVLYQQKLEQMHIRLKEIQAEKAHAYHASGDGWHDNPGWLQLGQQEEQLSRDIQQIQLRLQSAKVVHTQSRQPSANAQIGSKVHYTLVAVSGGKTISWTVEIVGSGEGNIRERLISYDSPIGKALIGKKAGDQINVLLPTGSFVLTLHQVD